MPSTDLSPLTYFFMIAGPTAAAILSFVFSIWYQNRKQRIEAQQNLFKMLMAHRGSGFRSFDLVGSMNLIDVVFANKPRIIELWHNYYNLSLQDPMNSAPLHYAYLDLVSEIGKYLGYRSLKQTDIAKYYNPRGYVEPLDLDQQIRHELLRVLHETARLVVDKKDDEKTSS